MLHVIFDRMSTSCAEHLRHMAASPMYYSLSGIESGRITEILEMYEANAVAGIFHAPEWDSHILIGFDRDFIYTMVEVLFGSDGSEPPIEEARGFSNIELRMAQTLFEQVAKALQASFSLIADTKFKLERIETRMDFAIIGRRNNQADRGEVSSPGAQPRRRNVRHHPAIGPEPDAQSPLPCGHRRIVRPRSALDEADRDGSEEDRGHAESRS